MKKILLALTIFAVSFAASAQQPTSNLYLQTGALPGYGYGPTPGNQVTYQYKNVQTGVGKDTLAVVTQTSFTSIMIDSLTANYTVYADTVGDTASQSNYPHGKATVWYKKNPFLLNHEGDELQMVIVGSRKAAYTVTFADNFGYFNWPVSTTAIPVADTTWKEYRVLAASYVNVLTIPKATTTGGRGVIITWKYCYQLNKWICKNILMW